MDYEKSDDSNAETSNDGHTSGEEKIEEGFGDDFDDFEAGAEGEDFGEFDDGFQEPEESPVEAEKQVQPDPSSLSPFVSSFSIVNTIHQMHSADLVTA